MKSILIKILGCLFLMPFLSCLHFPLEFRFYNDFFNYFNFGKELPDVSEYYNRPREEKIFQIPQDIKIGISTEPEKYIDQLVGFLISGTNDNYLKIKCIYDWICENIGYDNSRYVASKRDPNINDYRTMWEILIVKKGVCEDYSTIFSYMTERAGFEAHIVPGYAINNGNYNGQHAWNVVKINDIYYLIDSTWGRNNPSENFLADPAKFIYKHIPNDLRWTLADETSIRRIGNNEIINTIMNHYPMDSYTSIRNSAFANSYPKLTRATIPDSVVSIGDNAFNDNRLESVIIPSSVVSIGDNAFRNNQLTSVIILGSGVSIGNNAFRNNQLTSVIIPGSVASIGEEAFRNNQLTSVTIHRGVTSIGKGSFRDNQLTSVTIPGSVISIGEEAFINNQLTNVTMHRGVTSIGKGSFRDNKLTSVTIPDSVISIGEEAFRNNQLTSVTIHRGVTSIGKGSFRDNKLTSVNIPGSVASIGEEAFINNQLTSVTIHDGVTSIGRAAFSGSRNLRNVTIPASVTSIGATAFYGCNNLHPEIRGEILMRFGSGPFER